MTTLSCRTSKPEPRKPSPDSRNSNRSCALMGPSPVDIAYGFARPLFGLRCGMLLRVWGSRLMCLEGCVLCSRCSCGRFLAKVSNQEVDLRKAGLDPRQSLLWQAKSKGEAILADHRRASHIKVQESQHCYRVYQRMLSFEEDSSLTSLVRARKVDAVAAACAVCGVYYASQASLQMHIKHQHSEINIRSRLSFRRDRHALHGLPICRFWSGYYMIGALWRSMSQRVAAQG